MAEGQKAGVETGPPMVPPLRRGDVDSRASGNDGEVAGRGLRLARR